jgi:hypothetical protein
VTFIIGAVLVTKFTSRLSPQFIGQDLSIWHRLDLWLDGCKLIAASPLCGWGGGNAGLVYANWYQPIGERVIYGTMVNSYVNVGVEYGLPLLSVIVMLLFSAIGVGFSFGVWTEDILEPVAARQRMSGCVLVVWAVANLFTTLAVRLELWILPAIAIMEICVHGYKRAQRSVLPLVCACAALSMCATLYATGIWLENRAGIFITRVDGGAVAVKTRLYSVKRHNERILHIWVDNMESGESASHYLRRGFGGQKARVSILHDGGIPANTAKHSVGDIVILFGRQAERLLRDERYWAGAELILINPRSRMVPSIEPNTVVTVVLPEFDREGTNEFWEQWTLKNKGAVVVWPLINRKGRIDWWSYCALLGL